jgi:hypothetical protein
VLALVLVVLVFVFQWWRSDERRIKKALDELVELLEKKEAEDQLVAFGVARAVARRFAPGFVILAKPYRGRITDNEELMSAVLTFRNASPEISIDLGSVSLEVNKKRRTAAMGLEATVTMETGPGEHGRESYRVRLAWLNEEGRWLLHQVEVIEVLTDGPRLF